MLNSKKDSIKNSNQDTTDTMNQDNTNKATNNKDNKNTNNQANIEAVNKENTADSFFQLNTNISKFVFILLILIVFIMVFHLGLFLLEYAYGTTRTPYLIKGLIDSNKTIIVSSNPNINKSVPIIRSVNEINGIEYTWSLWFFIQDPFLNKGTEYKRIFSKGTNTMKDSLVNYNVSFLNNSPGLYYGEQDNKLTLVFNTYSQDSAIYETFDIEEIPIEKWVFCVITLKDKKVNVYINGLMTKEYILLNVPKQNYYDTTIGDNKGFGGYISNLRYYDYAMNEDSIQVIMRNGPNLTKESTNKIYEKPPWLSMNWYYNM